MRYFALFLMLLSLGLFAVGCAKEEPATPSVSDTVEEGAEEDAGGAAEEDAGGAAEEETEEPAPVAPGGGE